MVCRRATLRQREAGLEYSQAAAAVKPVCFSKWTEKELKTGARVLQFYKRMLMLYSETIPYAKLQRIMSSTIDDWNPLWSNEKTRNFGRKSMAAGTNMIID
jgi:hypothetical protein